MHGVDGRNEVFWRVTFGLAACHNLAFAVWAIVQPMAFFTWAELPAPRYPWIWSCLGMVIGVYGLGFAYVAWRPGRGDVVAALGLIGKLLGPIGWLWCVRQGEIPPRTFPLILANDLIWWFPFISYLLRDRSERRVMAALLVAAIHLGACVLLVRVGGGTEAEPDSAARTAFIAANAPAWVMCWFLWAGASLGLLAFFVLWACRLNELPALRPVIVVACGLCAIGLAFDLASEIMAIVVLTDTRLPVEQFAAHARTVTLLGAGVGNGLYCTGGLMLSAVSWNVRFQRGVMAWLAVGVWLSGLLLSVAAILEFHAAMVVGGVGLMALFIPWLALTAVHLRSIPGSQSMAR